MSAAQLRKEEISRIKEHVDGHSGTLAVVRTEHSSSELSPMFASLAEACGLSLSRTLSSPLSEFGLAEFNSRERMLILLHVVSDHTELLSVSETDESEVRELEEKIQLSNFQSEIIRLGL